MNVKDRVLYGFAKGQTTKRKALRLLFYVVLMLAAVRVSAQDDRSRIDRLIEQLGHKDYFVRERAQGELAKHSFEAFEALTEATKHEDLEVVARAKYLLHLMRMRWTKENDPEQVKKLLAGFETLDFPKKTARMHALASLDHCTGVPALCRLVRYQRSPVLRKLAAAALLLSQPLGEPCSAKFAAVLREQLSSSSTTEARWLTTYLQFGDNPAAVLDEWAKLIEAEGTILARSADQSDPQVVVALLRCQIAWCKKLDQRDEAVRAMVRLINLEKDNPEALARRLVWLVEEKEYEMLEEVATGLVSRFSGNPLPLYDVAQALVDHEQSERAKRIAALAMKAGHNVSGKLERHCAVAGVLQNRGQFQWARQEYRCVIDSGTPGSLIVVSAQYLLAEMLHDQNLNLDASKVLEDLVAVLDKQPNAAAALRVGVKSTRSRMHYFAACHWANENDTAKQRESLDKALAIDESDIDTLIACYRLKDQTPEYRKRIQGLIKSAAETLHEEAVRQPNLPTNYNQFAWLVGNTEGDMDEALRYSMKSLELAPDSGGYLDTLAHVYFGRGEYEKAFKTQAKAAKLEPHSGLIARPLEQFRKKWEEEKGGNRMNNNQ